MTESAANASHHNAVVTAPQNQEKKRTAVYRWSLSAASPVSGRSDDGTRYTGTAWMCAALLAAAPAEAPDEAAGASSAPAEARRLSAAATTSCRAPNQLSAHTRQP